MCVLFASDVGINLTDTQWCAQSIDVLICCLGDGEFGGFPWIAWSSSIASMIPANPLPLDIPGIQAVGVGVETVLEPPASTSITSAAIPTDQCVIIHILCGKLCAVAAGHAVTKSRCATVKWSHRQRITSGIWSDAELVVVRRIRGVVPITHHYVQTPGSRCRQGVELVEPQPQFSLWFESSLVLIPPFLEVGRVVAKLSTSVEGNWMTYGRTEKEEN